MMSKAEFAQAVRETAAILRDLAASAASVNTGVTPQDRDEAAEFLRQAAADCEDAVQAIER